MTLMLASVTGPLEAEIALAHGADIIDLDDRENMFAGAVASRRVRAVISMAQGRRPTSVTTGGPSAEPGALVTAVTEIAIAGADYVRVALPPGDRGKDCIRALATLAPRLKIVGMVLADGSADQALVPLMAASGFAGAMLDTMRGTEVGPLTHMDMPALAGFVDSVHASGMFAGFAGLLEAPDVPRLLLLSPDIMGFRDALCASKEGRAEIDPAAFDEIRGLIPVEPSRLEHSKSLLEKIDYRLLGGRGHSIDPHRKDENTDRVFVHDFVLPVRIGTYAHERDKPQNVRFNVDVKVLRANHAPEDMRDVFSYDLITDSIRMIVAREHIALVEMLAELIAAVILAHPRTMSATVRVEKLDVGLGTVGVEIARERTAGAAQVHRLFPVAATDSDPKAT